MGKLADWILKHRNPEKYARKLGVKIGKNCRIGIENWGSEPYLITIGDHVLLSSQITFLNHDGSTWVFREMPEYKDVNKFGTIEIGNNCFVGWACTFLPGTKMGNNCILGAGSLLTKSMPDGEVWAGVPARKICTTQEYAEKCKNGQGRVHFQEGDDVRAVLTEHFMRKETEEA